MNTYSRALRHISMKDVKQKHQKKLIEQKIQEEKKKEEEEYIASVMEEKKYDWREKLNETMTSSGMFFTTLPATGDVDLTVTSLDASGYEIDADVSFSSGTNSGFTGGFSSDNGIINLGGEGEYATGVVSNTFDFSTVDTVNITAIAGNNSNGGMLPTSSLELYFFTDDDVSDGIQVIPTSASSFATINVNIPEKFRTSSVGLVFLSDTSDGNGYHGRHFRNQTIPISGLNHTIMGNLFPQTATITGINAGPANLISSYLRTNGNSQSDYENLGEYIWFNSMTQRFGWFDNVGTPEDPELVYRTWPAAPISGATTEDAITSADYRYIGQTVYNLFKGTKLYGISNISFRRKTPMNVLVPLDSPEATSFVRTDPMMANLSPQERLKKLKDMLEASDEYVMKMLGLDFPGTGSVPPGEYDPFKQAPPGEAGDTPGVQVTDYQNAPGYMNIKVGDKEITRQYDRQGNYTGADSGWQPDPNAQSKSGSKSGSQKINFTHTYDVVTDSGVQKQKMNLSTTVPTDASGNLVNPFGNESPKSTNTSSQQKSQIQKAVLSNPEVANAVEKLGTAGKTYIDYLTNNLPAVIDNNYLGQKYVNSIFKNAQINHTGTVSVGDNIVGTGGKATYDPKTKKVSIPFNYDFKTNEQEFNDPSKAGRVNDFQKAVLNAVGPYSADAQLNTPILPLNSLAGIVLGGAIGVSKTLGGGQQRPGNVTMDAGELKKINPALYNQVVKEEFIIERRKLKSPEEVLNKIPGYYDKKPAPLGFPVEPPPEMVNGMHPDLVDGKKVADRFNRLDPESAKAMPLTGNPHIDKKVRAARKKPK